MTQGGVDTGDRQHSNPATDRRRTDGREVVGHDDGVGQQSRPPHGRLRYSRDMANSDPSGRPDRPLPRRMSQAEFGQRVMQWGTGDDSARALIGRISREDLAAAGVTLEMARAWLRFYERVVDEDPGRQNPSARGRVDLMKHIVELFEEGL